MIPVDVSLWCNARGGVFPWDYCIFQVSFLLSYTFLDLDGLERVLKGVYCLFLPIDLCLDICVLLRMLAVWYMLTVFDGCCTRLLYLYRFGLGSPFSVDSGSRPFCSLLFGFRALLFSILSHTLCRSVYMDAAARLFMLFFFFC